MNRLRAAFERLPAAGGKTLIPYITGGYPDTATTLAILRRVEPWRCACVEIGIPFSDPIADGPVIQTSFSEALERGFRVDDLLSALRQHRSEIAVPLVAMVSFSIVYRRTPQRFVQAARQAGIDGLIVPDLALEEAEELAAIGRALDCPLVMMVAPTTDAARRRRISALSEPFIYYQSLTGITGERQQLPDDLAAQVAQLRAAEGSKAGSPAKPICVGFGISTPAQVAAVWQVADGAIVGSAIVRRMNAAVARGEPPQMVAQAALQVIDELAGAFT